MKESDLKHGVVHQSKASIKWARARRPHINRHVAKASIPFDWNVGVDNTSGIKIKDQFQSDSCGGQAGAYYLESFFKIPISAKSIYAPNVAFGGGMVINVLHEQICAKGANLESAVPSYKPDGTTDEAWMTDLSYKNETIDLDAMARAGWSVVTVPRNAESIAQAIRDHGGVIWVIAGQNNNTWFSVSPQPPKNNQDLWRHFMTGLKAYLKNGIKTIRDPQSWGLGVGDNGFQDFDDTYLTSPYILDCVTFVRTATLTQQKTNILMAMIAWLKMMNPFAS